MSEALLPAAFADLRHLGEWIVPTEEGRHKKKIAADIETARRFYETVFPRMEAIIQHLNSMAWEGMAPADRNLFLLASMCMEVSHPVELGWQTTDIADAFPTSRVQFLSESAGYEAFAATRSPAAARVSAARAPATTGPWPRGWSG